MGGSAAVAQGETAPVIFDDQPHLLLSGLEYDSDPGRLGVPRNIGQRFLQHAVKRGLDRSRQAARLQGQVHVELQLRAFAPGVEQVADGSGQAKIVQSSRANFPGQAVDLPAKIVGDLLQASELSETAGVGASDPLQAQLQQGQRLTQTVTQFAGDTLPLGFLFQNRAP